jgi:hypothetical protein
MRTQRGEMPRQEGDVACGGMIGYYELLTWLRAGRLQLETGYGGLNRRRQTTIPQENENIGLSICSFHRLITHCSAVEIQRLRVPAARAQNAKLRVRYMTNEIDDDEFKRLVVLKEKNLEKQRNCFNVMEMFVAAASDLFRNMLGETASLQKASEFLDQFNTLRNYTNSCFVKISASFFGATVPKIENEHVTTQKA